MTPCVQARFRLGLWPAIPESTRRPDGAQRSDRLSESDLRPARWPTPWVGGGRSRFPPRVLRWILPVFSSSLSRRPHIRFMDVPSSALVADARDEPLRVVPSPRSGSNCRPVPGLLKVTGGHGLPPPVTSALRHDVGRAKVGDQPRRRRLAMPARPRRARAPGAGTLTTKPLCCPGVPRPWFQVTSRVESVRSKSPS